MARALLAIALACYPFVVYLLLGTVPPQVLILTFGILAACRFLMIKDLAKPYLRWLLVGLGAFCIVAALDTDLVILKFYPVLVNSAAATYGLYTIFNPPSAIEQLSRLMGMQMDGPAVFYTRRLTMVWIGFFVLNAATAAYTVLAASTATWALYNGLISYLLIGLLMVLEYPVRLLFKKRHPTS